MAIVVVVAAFSILCNCFVEIRSSKRNIRRAVHNSYEVASALLFLFIFILLFFEYPVEALKELACRISAQYINMNTYRHLISYRSTSRLYIEISRLALSIIIEYYSASSSRVTFVCSLSYLLFFFFAADIIDMACTVLQCGSPGVWLLEWRPCMPGKWEREGNTNSSSSSTHSSAACSRSLP